MLRQIPKTTASSHFVLVASTCAGVFMCLVLSLTGFAQEHEKDANNDSGEVRVPTSFDPETLPSKEDWKTQRRFLDEKALIPEPVPETARSLEQRALLHHLHAQRQEYEQQLELARTKLAEREAQVAQLARQMSMLERARSLPPLPEDAEIKVFTLHNVPAEKGAATIESLLGTQALRIAIDDRTNSLITAGKASQLKAVETLLTRLDASGPLSDAGKQPPAAKPTATVRSLLLRVFWLADGLLEDEGQHPTEFLPESVLKATQKLGLTDARLVTQTVNSLAVNSEDAVEFSTHIPASLFNHPVRTSTSGRVKLVNDDRAALEMNIQVAGPSTSNELKGSLAIPLGHYMVLGTANSVIGDAAPRGGRSGMRRGRGEMGMMGRGEMGRYGARAVDQAGKGGFGRGGYVEGAVEAELEMGEGMEGPDQPPTEPKFSTSRFAFVVQVIEGESYPAEKANTQDIRPTVP